MATRRFPIGIQDFAQLRNDQRIYVDKTELIYKMVTADRFYFMSRPRRFGKSLLVSTLDCYFSGRKELFDGLYIAQKETEWKQHPVFKISFARNKYDTVTALQVTLSQILGEFEKKYGIENTCGNEWGPRLANILNGAFAATGTEPVVLVDEYDAPLLDSLNNPELQQQLKNELRKLFSPLKDLGGILRFVFLTGISKFSQLSIFSELNNLKVITMDDSYSALCGITKEELYTQMQPEIQALADKQGMTYNEACDMLRQKYDGYHFSSNSADIYNPFSVLNALSSGEFGNYWFSTGTPTILTEMIKRYKIEPTEFDTGFTATLDMFDTPTENATDPIPMLYQSGYLTIKGTRSGNRFTLGFPNDEVRYGFINALLPYYATPSPVKNGTFLLRFADALEDGDIEQALTLMKAFFSSVPYNAEHKDENHYKTLFFLIFKLCTPYVVRTEECSAAGRADAVVETADAVYVFEFKLDSNGTAADALRQIDEKGYLIPYSATCDADGIAKKLVKIGVAFDEERRTLGKWIIA